MSQPRAEKSQKPFLERYAVVIALGSVLIAVPSALIALYQWSTDASGPVLTVSAKANAFAIPPSPPIPNGYDPAETFGEYKTYVTMTLKNTGDLPAEGVRVVLPRFGDFPPDGRFFYERSDGATRNDRFVSEFDIGTLEAEQLIDLSFWTTEELAESDVLTLSSKSGKETVRLRSSEELGAMILGIRALFVLVALHVLVQAGVSFRNWRMGLHQEERVERVERLAEHILTNDHTPLSLMEIRALLAEHDESTKKNREDNDMPELNED